ncbi:MAG: (Fe-S)-binding protein, partial [Spirochaetota bacterium]
VGSGLLVNAARIAICGYPAFEMWSPASFLLSFIFYFISPDILVPVHFILWWGHILLACILIAFAGAYKIGSYTIAMMNIYCAPIRSAGGAAAYPAQLVSEEEIAAGKKGAANIDDLTWKQMMDLSACVRCGRCQDRCPAYLSGLPLSPKKFINDLKFCMDEHNLFANGEPRPGEVKDYVKADELWACTECGACMEFCPAQIDHVQKVIDLRRSFALRADVPESVISLWKNIEQKGNPSGGAESTRAECTVPPLSENDGPEYLFFAGCAAAYNTDAKKSAQAFLSLMKKAGISIGVLGAEESCCGDTALRSGNEELFRQLAMKNLEKFTSYGVKKIVTACPHGYNVLSNEYRML